MVILPFKLKRAMIADNGVRLYTLYYCQNHIFSQNMRGENWCQCEKFILCIIVRIRNFLESSQNIHKNLIPSCWPLKFECKTEISRFHLKRSLIRDASVKKLYFILLSESGIFSYHLRICGWGSDFLITALKISIQGVDFMILFKKKFGRRWRCEKSILYIIVRIRYFLVSSQNMHWEKIWCFNNRPLNSNAKRWFHHSI